MNNIDMAEELRNRNYGHKHLWEGKTLVEFIDLVTPEMKKHIDKNKLSQKVVSLACGFLRIKFEQNELSGTVSCEVSKAIEESMIYYANCLGEDI